MNVKCSNGFCKFDSYTTTKIIIMKFTYTHITENTITKEIYKISKNNKITKTINMYETLEHWNQYKQEKDQLQQSKELFNECGFQYKEKAKQEMDKFLNKLIKKNGVTKV